MSEPTRVLVVDDEPQLIRALRINLNARGFDVTTVSTGAAALAAAARTDPHVVVLDLGLPDIDGFTVLEGLRGWTTVPVIVLSARTDASDKVAALDAGADDYVTKPFGMEEFLARLRAAVRRGAVGEPTAAVPVVDADAFTVDLAAKQVTRGGVPVHLTPTEWGVLELLVRNEGKLVGQREILTAVWGPTYVNQTNYLRVYLAGLRRKLEDDPAAPVHLLTEAGMGYRFVRGTGSDGNRKPVREEELREAAGKASGMQIDTWWPRLSAEARAWLIEHNGEPLDAAVRTEILTVTDGATDPAWWAGDQPDGSSELADAAVDWIESTANAEPG
ncbi:two-component response regulator KdpE [Gordonia soli NBRC 108243]|uniref:Transcriptional regulatory protein KdpE n=1 Tax=Gordonia soli NBRC 108243 TaxID=1223545 RepID=M0QFC1_9ACTN|nr:two-component response regulator KdpE [Gordonia soli NBRC 108243]